MSTVQVQQMLCDREGCRRPFGPSGRSAVAARRIAARRGWVRTAFGDLCPECAVLDAEVRAAAAARLAALNGAR